MFLTRQVFFCGLIALAAPSSASAGALANAPARQFGEKFFAAVGLPHLYADEQALFLLALGCFAALFGYLAHIALFSRGFGVILNSVLSAVGVCAALRFGLPLLPPQAGAGHFNAALLLAASGAPFALIGAALLKRAASWFVAHIALAFSPRRGPIEEPPLDPKILNVLRKIQKN